MSIKRELLSSLETNSKSLNPHIVKRKIEAGK